MTVPQGPEINLFLLHDNKKTGIFELKIDQFSTEDINQIKKMRTQIKKVNSELH